MLNPLMLMAWAVSLMQCICFHCSSVCCTERQDMSATVTRCCWSCVPSHAHSSSSDQSSDDADRQTRWCTDITADHALSTTHDISTSLSYLAAFSSLTQNLYPTSHYDNNERSISTAAGDDSPSSQGASRASAATPGRSQSTSSKLRSVLDDDGRRLRTSVADSATTILLDVADGAGRWQAVRQRQLVPRLPQRTDGRQQRRQQHVSSHWLPQCTSRCIPRKSADRSHPLHGYLYHLQLQ